MLFELVFVPSYCTEDVRLCLFVRTLFSFLVSYFCNLLAFSSTFLVATKISVSTSRVSLFYCLGNLKSLFHLLCASERARGERASRRSIRRDFFVFLREKKGYFDVSSQVYVKFSLFRPDLPLDLSSGVPLLFNVRH